ncbi:MAG: M48 family metallopeptidase [Pseudomonadota bacterium]
MPALGWALHGLEQYQREVRPTVRTIFGFEAPVAVEAVVPGGAAARADVRANDSLAAIGSTSVAEPVVDASAQTADRDRVLGLLEALAPDAPINVTILRGAQRLEKSVTPEAACRSRFEIVVGKGFDAGADGGNVQLGERFFEGFSEEEIAVVVAHELAHNILHHRDRLDAAKVSRGIAGEFGRNSRLIRQTEDEADRLSVYLLANAGYDPYAPGRFWRVHANKVGMEGIFRSRTHASAKARAEAMDAIAKTIGGASARPIIPDLIAARDKILN